MIDRESLIEIYERFAECCEKHRNDDCCTWNDIECPLGGLCGFFDEIGTFKDCMETLIKKLQDDIKREKEFQDDIKRGKAMKALEIVRNYCLSNKCMDCPLYSTCKKWTDCTIPTLTSYFIDNIRKNY